MNFNNSLSSNFVLLALFVFSAFSITSCKKDEDVKAMASFEYKLHNGQTVPSAPYIGTHANDFSVMMEVEELDDDKSMINLTLNNTIDGATYHIHAHDADDPATTPNGTPYNETPNADVFVQMATGNGGTVTISQESTMSFTELTTTYAGFFVVHDPLQTISTTNISTYLTVGGFAREQASTSGLSSMTFDYPFSTSYSGTHATNLSASLQVDELSDGRSRVTVRINNTVDGETYHTHAHDKADPATTPNGTPYNETPNPEAFVGMLVASGSSAGMAQITSSSYANLTGSYDGFFVIHDPLQTISTTDLSTYVVLGDFAR